MTNATPERLKNTQQAFSAYIRDPQHAPLPEGVQKARMDMYHELFFNNIDSFLAGGFPVLKRILSEAQWQALAQDFFASHTCTTPYFSEIAEEFLTYLQSQPPLLNDFPPFLLELAHYEWVEMALSISQEETPKVNAAFLGNPCVFALALSPLAWPLAYRFPVQRLAPQFQPQSPPDNATYLVVFRDENFEVRFLEITPLTFTLLQLLQEQPGMTGEQYLRQIAEASPSEAHAAIYTGGSEIIKNLAKLGIVVNA